MRQFIPLSLLAGLASPAAAYLPIPRGIDTRAATNGTEPCYRVAQEVKRGVSKLPVELAYQCLQSVPLKVADARETIEQVIRSTQFQSTLAYLKNPPSDYLNPAVDIIGGLEDIARSVEDGKYTSQYEFEADITRLIMRANDGHFVWEGDCFSGVFLFERHQDLDLITAATGDGLPKIFTKAGNYTSAVTKINSVDAVRFLQNEADNEGLQDPDARWNSMMFAQPASASGNFLFPDFYPGKTTTLTFENGMTRTWPNQALLLSDFGWGDVVDGESFYNTFVKGSASFKRSVKAAEKFVPTKQHRLRRKLGASGDVPQQYPTPFIDHPDRNIGVAGFFLDVEGTSDVAVLMLATFEDSSFQFINIVGKMLAECRKRGTSKIIIDMRDNPGGFVDYGYKTFLQFFPNVEPFGGINFRIHNASEIMGEQFSANDLHNSINPFTFNSFVDGNLKRFSSWEDMNGPVSDNDDTFTELLRLPPSRSNANTATFAPEDIVLLTDGQCSSTCTIFAEFMTQQVSGVKTVAIGGRPQEGPMPITGGVKGSRVLDISEIEGFARGALRSIESADEVAAAKEVLPVAPPIQTNFAAVNFENALRSKDAQTPTQFIYDPSECRIFYTREMYSDVTLVWKTVHAAAFGNGGGYDSSMCVSGGTQEQPSEPGTTTTASSASMTVAPVSQVQSATATTEPCTTSEEPQQLEAPATSTVTVYATVTVSDTCSSS